MEPVLRATSVGREHLWPTAATVASGATGVVERREFKQREIELFEQFFHRDGWWSATDDVKQDAK